MVRFIDRKRRLYSTAASQLYTNSTTSALGSKTIHSSHELTQEPSRSTKRTATHSLRHTTASYSSYSKITASRMPNWVSVSSTSSDDTTYTSVSRTSRSSAASTFQELEVTTYDYTQLFVVTDSDTTFTTHVHLTTQATFTPTSSFSISSAIITTDANAFSKFLGLHRASAHHSVLSTGAKAGIGVGVAIGFLLAMGFVVLSLYRRKKKKGAFGGEDVWDSVPNGSIRNDHEMQTAPLPPPPRKRVVAALEATPRERLIDVLHENSQESLDQQQEQRTGTNTTPKRYDSHIQNLTKFRETSIQDVGDTLGSFALRNGQLRPQTWWSDIDSSEDSTLSGSTASGSVESV
ncbi:hypothetical protein KL938_002584 [Ogataea parapolymorpha]|nr:hypothetical protein KL938_002584 [Ogataea parapolymorpha]